MNYLEVVSRASRGELSVKDLNEIVVAFAANEREQDKKIAKHDRGFRDIEEEYPLLPPEADDLSNKVKKKGVQMLGGKNSNAYADKDLRSRVYRDIYGEVKREYGLINNRGGQMSYKKLKRKYLEGAMNTIDAYVLPTALEEEIDALNDLDLSE